MLRPNNNVPLIYLYRDAVDFRKSYNGLAAIIEQELNHDPFSGILYVFRNRHRNKIKCLFWDKNGFVLYYKSLSEEKFHWPKDDDNLVKMTGQTLNWLLDGYNINAMQAHKSLSVTSLC